MEPLWVGLSGTGNWDDDHRPKDWDQKYTQLFPYGKASLNAILSLMEAEQADDQEIYWWEDELQAQGADIEGVYYDTALQQAYQSGDDKPAGTVVYVKLGANTDVRRFRPGLEVMLREGNDLRNDVAGKVIDTSEGAYNWVAVRLLQADGSGPGDLSDSDYLMVIGDINPQAGFPVVPRTYERTKVYNYLQIFKETYQYSRSMKQTAFKTGRKDKWLEARALQLFNEQRENAFLWGPRSMDINPENGQEEYTTGGIVSFLKSAAPQNVRHYHLFDGSSPYKGQAWESKGKRFLDESLELLFHWSDGSMGRKVALCGNGALSGINRLVETHGQFNVTSETTTFGWNVTKYVSPFGVVKFLTYPQFNLYKHLSHSVLFLEPHNLKRKYMQRTTKRDVTPEGFDGEKYEFLSEEGLKIRYPKTMMLLTGVGMDNNQS